MNIFWTVFWIFIILNSIIAILTVFREKTRDIAATWAWLLVIIMLPGLGLIGYLFLGRKISKENIFDIKKQSKIGYDQLIEAQRKKYTTTHIEGLQTDFAYKKLDMVNMFLSTSNAILTRDNHVEIFDDGKQKFDQLLRDISKAQDHIHLNYYIFRGDNLGQAIVDALEERANNGVEVRVLYDPLGARYLNKSFFAKLKSFGGEAYPVFGARVHLLNIRLNFRSHRKIVVIDGKIGYTGGFNVGDDYLGEYEHMGYWRDTHIKIEGNGVIPLQSRFIMDWNASAVENEKLNYQQHYFPISDSKGETDLQIVSSGPDSEMQDIKKGFLRMISLAKSSVYIQTPYFIPDDALLETIEIAVHSGVDVKVMIPNKPDHPFIYRATLSYAEQLVEMGVEVYVYDSGFLHSKTISIDDEILSIGTANFDIRSFKLNFEVNAFLYDEKLTADHVKIYKKDMENSYLLTKEIIASYSLWEKFKQQFSRLLSPIL